MGKDKIEAAHIKFKQPSALCKLLAARWCACLLGTIHTDRTVMSWLTGSNVIETFAKTGDKEIRERKALTVEETFKDKTLSQPAYGKNTGNITDINVLLEPQGKTNTAIGNQETVSYMARLVSTGNVANPETIAAEMRQIMADEKGGYYISLHYEYVLTGRKSGHAVGFFDPPNVRRNRERAQFFDPNNGAWRFASFEESVDFFADEWLPRFSSGNLRGDPGEPTDKQRTMSDFTINQIIMCRSPYDNGKLSSSSILQQASPSPSEELV
jgi:hypothetical protein